MNYSKRFIRLLLAFLIGMTMCIMTVTRASAADYTIANAFFVSAGTLGISQDMLQWSDVDAPRGYKLEIYTESGTQVYSGTLTINYTPASEVLTASGTYYFTVYALDTNGNELSSKTSDNFTYTHTHSLTHVEPQGATCTETGNSEYWYCSVCGGYFSDSGALGTTSLSDVTIAAKGHSWGGTEYLWSSDMQTCTATRTCQNDSSHVDVAYATVTSVVKKATTCTEYGEITYIGSFSVDWATQQLRGGIIGATGHSYDTDGFCANCGGYKPATLNSSVIYEISNPGQLFWFASLVNGDTTQSGITAANTSASAILKADITIPSGYEWTPIGTKDAPYTGTFDGDGYTVSGMSITTASNYMGLFGYVSVGTIKDLTVSGKIDVSGSSLYAGGIVGTVSNGTLSNLTSNVSVTAYDGKKGTFGGVAATVEDGSTMELCVNNGKVTASGVLDCVGGLVGYMNSATITNCLNNGTVDTSGGTAAASAGIYTGGIISYINNANAVVTNCVNVGTISGINSSSIVSYTGAIVGRINQNVKEVSNCYYLSDASGTIVGIGGNGSSVSTETTAQTAEEFATGEAAWNLQNANTDYVWGQELSTYPYPVLTDDTDIKVVKVSFYRVTNGAAEADPLTYGYTNYGLAYSDYPTDTSYTFYSDVNLSSEITDTTVYTFTSDGIVYVKQAYSVTNSLTNITSNNTATTINYGESYSATLTGTNCYVLPDSITVTAGGTELTVGTDYTYDSSTGELIISNVTGNIVITAAAANTSHSYDGGEVTTAATCTADGVMTYTCKVCGDTYTEVIPATGHTTEIQNAKAATCTTDGYTGDEVCTVCGETITAGEVIPATGHTTETQNAKAATCTEDGCTGDEVCTVCGETVTTGEVIPATGHTTEVQNAKEATCTEDGYTGDEICTLCGETISTGEVISAKGHSYVYTDNGDGTHNVSCENCDYTETGAACIYDENGNCIYCGGEEEKDEPVIDYIIGDVDNNGIITANDSAALLHWVLTGEANPNWIIHDVDEDGTIDAVDAAKILCKVLNSAYSYKG